MAHEQHSTSSAAGDILHLADGLLLELGVADGEDFVDDEDFGLEVGGDGKAEADHHAARIALDRRVEISFAAAEVHDFVELALDFRRRHPHDRPVHEDVLPAGHFGMEAGADLQERADAAARADDARRRGRHAGQEFQEGRLAGAVAADDPDDVALLDLEVDVAQRPDVVARSLGRAVVRLADLEVGVLAAQDLRLPEAVEVVGERPGAHEPQAVLLADVVEFNGGHGISSSLYRVNKPALRVVEDDDAEGEENGAECCTIPQRRPGEGADAEDAVLEGLDDRRDGIRQHDHPDLVAGDRAERVDDRRGVHPKLDEEGEQICQITVLGRERTEHEPESEPEPGQQKDQNGRQQDDGVRADRCVRNEQVVEIDGEEEQHLDEQPDQIARDGGKRNNEPREVNLPEDMGVGAEGRARLVQAVGEILPEADAGEVEEGLGEAIRRDARDAAEDDHVHDRRENRLDEEPERAQDRLLVDRDDVAPDEHREEVAVAPELLEVDLEQTLLGPDDERPGFFGFCLGIGHFSGVGRKLHQF